MGRVGLALLLAAAVAPLFAQQQNTGSLSVKASTGRAGVFVDGKYLGPAANFGSARTYKVAAGDHELKLVEPRFEEFTQKVSIQAGKKTTVDAAMKALPIPKGPFGVLRVQNADKFAAVYLNGKYYGHAGEFNNAFQGILLAPGEYEVKVEPLAGAPITTKAKIQADKTVVVK